jgi:hypothetical protein
MLRRPLLAAAPIGACAALGSATQAPAPAEASPAYANVAVSFAADVTKDGEALGEGIELSSNEHVVWAVLSFDGLGPGTKLTDILRLNGWDYKWGDTGCCKGISSGTVAFPLSRRDGGGTIPGGAYALYIYDGDTEVARGGFGVRGGKGSDNDNDH